MFELFQEFNNRSLIAQFKIPRVNEKILNMYKLIDYNIKNERKKQNYHNMEKDITVDPIDTLVLVTNFGIYKLIFRFVMLKLFFIFLIKNNF